MKKLNNPTLCCVIAATLLASCGGGGGSSNNETDTPEDDGITDNLPDTEPDPTDDIPSNDTGAEPDDNPINLPTDDVLSGGYVGSDDGLRDTFTMPDPIVGHQVGVLVREGSVGVKAGGTFLTFDDERRYSEFVSDFTRPLDSCHQTFPTALRVPGFANRFRTPFGVESFSAGEVLPLFGPGGSVGELQRVGFDGAFEYLVERDSVESSTESEEFILSVSIPGDSFPAVETIAFPDTQELRGFSSIEESFFDFENDFNLADISTLVWEASDDPNAYIHLEFFANIPESPGSFDRDSYGFNCSLVDDGEFTFPEEIRALYTLDPAAAELQEAARISVNVSEQDDSTLFLINIQDAN